MSTNATLRIDVIGAGIFGLWQAIRLTIRGHRVRLFEQRPRAEALVASSSAMAGAMLAPYCESEQSEPIILELGRESLPIWQDLYPDLAKRGTLVVAPARDRSELTRFARLTQGHAELCGERIAALEADLAGRFTRGLFYAEEAHMEPRAALAFLLEHGERLGVETHFGPPGGERAEGGDAQKPGGAHAPRAHDEGSTADWVVDCRGLAARDRLAGLRGVRGEFAILRAPDVTLTRPVRLLHPRFPIYVVPWGKSTYMVGASVVEREDDGPVTTRSTLELLGTAYALHPAFGEAEILRLGVGVRPAFADNTPRITVRDRVIYVNGAYRHGFLSAPALADLVGDFLQDGRTVSELFVDHNPEWQAASGECEHA